MDYKTAAKIRGKSLRDLIQSGGGVSESVSDKFQAKMVGIKERFDPLNILSFMGTKHPIMTGMVGRLLGGTDAEIAYFANKGKAKSISKTTKIGPSATTDMVSTLLMDMLSFMRKSREEDIRRNQIKDTFQEEKITEDLRRHNELLEAIGKIGTIEGAPTATKEESGTGFLDILKNMIDGVLETVKKMIPNFILNALESIGDVIKFVRDISSVIGRTTWGILTGLLRFLTMTPLGRAIVIGVGIGYEIWKLWNESDEESRKAALTKTDILGNPIPQALSDKDPIEEEKQKDLIKSFRNKMIQNKGDLSSATTEEIQAMKDEMSSYGAVPLEKQSQARSRKTWENVGVLEMELDKRKSNTATKLDVSKYNLTPSTAGAGRSSMSGPTAEDMAKLYPTNDKNPVPNLLIKPPVSAVPPTTTPIPPPTSPIVEIVKQNSNLQMESAMTGTKPVVISDTKNNTTNTSQDSGTQMDASVRDYEDQVSRLLKRINTSK